MMMTTQAAAGGDPYWSNVKLLVQAAKNSANSATFLENAASVTVDMNGCQVSTAAGAAKFGDHYFRFQSAGNGHDIRIRHARLSNVSVFTYEFWANVSGANDSNGNMGIWSVNTKASSIFDVSYVRGNTNCEIRTNEDLTTPVTQTTATNTFNVCNVWRHFCLEKTTAGALRFYIDGSVRMSSNTVSLVQVSVSGEFRFGRRFSGSWRDAFGGKMDQIRFTRDIPRYKGSFTPPTEAFPVG